jgi:hypothetical protein
LKNQSLIYFSAVKEEKYSKFKDQNEVYLGFADFSR